MIPMKIEKVFIFDKGFGVFLFLEIRLSALHNDIGVVIVLDAFTDENLLVGATESFFDSTPYIVGGEIASAGDQKQGGGAKRNSQAQLGTFRP